MLIPGVSDKVSKATAHSYNVVVKLFSDYGYTLLTKESNYKNSRTKLQYLCPTHGVQETTYASFSQHRICRQCSYDNTIRGSNNSNWKGGVSELNHYLRYSLVQWKKDSLESAGYKCYITGSGGTLEIHHEYSFHKIVKETLEQLQLPTYQNIGDYTEEELKSLTEKFIESNYLHGLGKCLLPEVHSLFHQEYHYDNTPEQFEEFIQRYKEGYFIG